MLVHICCSVDSHYFLQKLKADYPNENLIGFFYDPNIHPYSEYELRLLDVKRSCKMLGVELIEGDYDIEAWLSAVKGYENEPEKGKRCALCFDKRFEVSAKKCAELGEKSFTSTLLTSPKKSLSQLKKEGDRLAQKYGVKFIAPDYRKKSGTQEQNIIAKEAQLYRQDYCGCIYGLKIQRDEQKKLEDELFVPISGQIQPESIEERLKLYTKRVELEELGIPYKIVKERFLNWRLKRAFLRVSKRVIPSHILPYSTIKRDYTRGRVTESIGELSYLNRDEVKFITLNSYNQILKKDYSSIKELIFNPPSFEEELEIRRILIPSPYDLSAIFVVSQIPESKLEIALESEVYEDVREKLMVLNR